MAGAIALKKYNPTQSVATPTIDHLFSDCPNLLIEASGEAVGLPEGQMGNSEVGHLHIGAGRKVPQDLVRINNEIKNSAFLKMPCCAQQFKKPKIKTKRFIFWDCYLMVACIVTSIILRH